MFLSNLSFWVRQFHTKRSTRLPSGLAVPGGNGEFAFPTSASTVGIGAGAAFGPEQIYPAVAPEIRMKRDAEQAAFRTEVHRQVERGRPDHAIDDALHAAGGFLGDEEIVLAEKCDADGLRESAHDRTYREIRIDDCGRGCLCAALKAVARPKSSGMRDFISVPSLRAGVPGCCEMKPDWVRAM